MDLKGLKAMLATAESAPVASPATIAGVNEAIAKEGGKERLIKNGGFLRFTDGDTDWWIDTVAKVQNVTELTIEQWLDEWREMRDQ